ncbi:hypothetical protein Neosp_001799 [[Neocosmospora] mangrovei]
MAEPQLELQSLGRCILGTFRALSDATWDITEDNGFPSKDRISIEHQRFLLWARSLGLNQVGHASLDYRVRDASVVKVSLADLLTELGDHLDNLLGSRQPLEQDPGSSHRDQDPSSETTLSDDGSSLSSLSSFGSFREADFRLESVGKRLDALYELASRIRSPRNRPQRPVEELYKHVPERQRADYMESQKQIEVSRVSYVQKQQLLLDFAASQLEELGISQDQLLQEYSSADHWLIRRIGTANARRKQQFVYWRRHAKLLSRDMIETETLGPAASAVVQSPASPVSESKTILRKAVPSVSIATSATRLDPEAPGLGDTASVISRHSRVSTAVGLSGEDLTWPAAPKDLEGSKHFSCPYYYIKFTTFSLISAHTRIALILAGFTGYGRTGLTTRINTVGQDEHRTEERLPEMVAAVVGSSLKPLRDCPFCPTAFFDVPAMQKHVRYHLERLALYALPDIQEQEGDELASVQPSDSHKLVENQGRRASITRDFSEEEEEAFSKFWGPKQPHKSFLTTESIEALARDERSRIWTESEKVAFMSSLTWTFEDEPYDASTFDQARSDEDPNVKSAKDKANASPDLEGELRIKNDDDFTNEGLILLLGVTGSGKTYFLNKLKRHSVKEGHGLRSETTQCNPVQIFLDEEGNRSITVVDTPGFDDTSRPEGEILAEIVGFLATQHALGVPLRGVLYLHKITDIRMTGSSLTYLNLFRSLVGEDALENVVLVTSMWNRLRDEDRSQGLQREQELLDTYWSPMLIKGSYVFQFDGTTESALSLVYHLAQKKAVVLKVQKEIMDQDKSVLGTSAGQYLGRKLVHDTESYRARADELEARLQEELRGQPQDRDLIRMLRQDKAQTEELLKHLEESMERMKDRPRSSTNQRIKQIQEERGGGTIADRLRQLQ